MARKKILGNGFLHKLNFSLDELGRANVSEFGPIPWLYIYKHALELKIVFSSRTWPNHVVTCML